MFQTTKSIVNVEYFRIMDNNVVSRTWVVANRNETVHTLFFDHSQNKLDKYI